MRAGDAFYFFLALRERDVKAGFPVSRALDEKLHSQRGFSRPRISLNEIDGFTEKPAQQHLIQAGYTGPRPLERVRAVRVGLFNHAVSSPGPFYSWHHANGHRNRITMSGCGHSAMPAGVHRNFLCCSETE